MNMTKKDIDLLMYLIEEKIDYLKEQKNDSEFTLKAYETYSKDMKYAIGVTDDVIERIKNDIKNWEIKVDVYQKLFNKLEKMKNGEGLYK